MKNDVPGQTPAYAVHAERISSTNAISTIPLCRDSAVDPAVLPAEHPPNSSMIVLQSPTARNTSTFQFTGTSSEQGDGPIRPVEPSALNTAPAAAVRITTATNSGPLRIFIPNQARTTFPPLENRKRNTTEITSRPVSGEKRRVSNTEMEHKISELMRENDLLKSRLLSNQVLNPNFVEPAAGNLSTITTSQPALRHSVKTVISTMSKSTTVPTSFANPLKVEVGQATVSSDSRAGATEVGTRLLQQCQNESSLSASQCRMPVETDELIAAAVTLMAAYPNTDALQAYQLVLSALARVPPDSMTRSTDSAEAGFGSLPTLPSIPNLGDVCAPDLNSHHGIMQNPLPAQLNYVTPQIADNIAMLSTGRDGSSSSSISVIKPTFVENDNPNRLGNMAAPISTTLSSQLSNSTHKPQVRSDVIRHGAEFVMPSDEAPKTNINASKPIGSEKSAFCRIVATSSSTQFDNEEALNYSMCTSTENRQALNVTNCFTTNLPSVIPPSAEFYSSAISGPINTANLCKPPYGDYAMQSLAMRYRNGGVDLNSDAIQKLCKNYCHQNQPKPDSLLSSLLAGAATTRKSPCVPESQTELQSGIVGSRPPTVSSTDAPSTSQASGVVCQVSATSAGTILHVDNTRSTYYTDGRYGTDASSTAVTLNTLWNSDKNRTESETAPPPSSLAVGSIQNGLHFPSVLQGGAPRFSAVSCSSASAYSSSRYSASSPSANGTRSDSDASFLASPHSNTSSSNDSEVRVIRRPSAPSNNDNNAPSASDPPGRDSRVDGASPWMSDDCSGMLMDTVAGFDGDTFEDAGAALKPDMERLQYKDRRRRNNEAAKRCRANRRAIFEFRSRRVAQLERENVALREQLLRLRNELDRLKTVISLNNNNNNNDDKNNNSDRIVVGRPNVLLNGNQDADNNMQQ